LVGSGELGALAQAIQRGSGLIGERHLTRAAALGRAGLDTRRDRAADRRTSAIPKWFRLDPRPGYFRYSDPAQLKRRMT
jgi:hypothetical protein